MVTKEEYVENIEQIYLLDDQIRDYINKYDDGKNTKFLPEVLVQRKEIHRNMKKQMRSLSVKDRISLTVKYIEYKCETYKIHNEISKYILRKYDLK